MAVVGLGLLMPRLLRLVALVPPLPTIQRTKNIGSAGQAGGMTSQSMLMGTRKAGEGERGGEGALWAT